MKDIDELKSLLLGILFVISIFGTLFFVFEQLPNPKPTKVWLDEVIVVDIKGDTVKIYGGYVNIEKLNK
jgi:hypothetical protein